MHKREIRELICSMLLGDGYLRIVDTPRHSSSTFWIEHSQYQMDYLLWKKDQIDSIFQDKNIDRVCRFYSRDRYDKRTNKIYRSCSICLNWRPYLSFLYRKVYKGDRSKNIRFLLDNISLDKHLAIWFMDDASESKSKAKHIDGTVYFKNPYFRLAMYPQTIGECQLTKEWFQRIYHVYPSINKYKHGPILQFSVADSKRLFPHIRPYVANIESMRRKFSLCLERY